MDRQKRVMAVHDISCFGKCSLTVAMPIISATGIEVSIIPTAVLSTHTGGFHGFTYRDLTEDIEPITNHWKSLHLSFDAIYTGFLGSFHQIEIVSHIFDDFKTKDNLIFVDPAMADNGKMYSLFNMDFAKGMAALCQKADLIKPNITEAAFMLGEEYREGPYTKEYIENLLKRLGNSEKKVVLTGVYFDDKKLGAASYDGKTGEISYSFADKIEGYYHGTGDTFGSALIAAMLNGKTLSQAAAIAVHFTANAIARTKEAGTDVRFGVNFEAGLKDLAEVCK